MNTLEILTPDLVQLKISCFYVEDWQVYKAFLLFRPSALANMKMWTVYSVRDLLLGCMSGWASISWKKRGAPSLHEAISRWLDSLASQGRRE
jgi:hypothetical protein